MHEILPLDALPERDRKVYHQLRHSRGVERHGCFLAESDKVVERLLRSPLTLRSMLADDVWLDRLMPLLQSRESSFPVYRASAEEIGSILGFSVRQAVRAIAEVPDSPVLASFFPSTGSRRFLVALDGLSNAENVGVMVRNASALGADAILVGPTSSSPYLSRAVRVSMGAVFQIPILEVRDLPLALRQLAEAGVISMAAALRPHATALHEADFLRDICLVFGSEGTGIRPSVLEACQETVMLPMARGVDSLNVGTAGAAMLYEVRRQRGDWPR